MQEFTKKNARVWAMLGMRRVIGHILSDMAEMDERFLFMTADVARYFGTEKFQQEYPDRILDVGIAEQNLVGLAAGLAKEGEHVFAATYATFVTARALDQVRVSMGYMKLGVKLIGVGGGLAEGDLSATHMGLEDIADIRAIPGIAVICPADATEAVKAMYALSRYDGPAYLRLSGKEGIPIVYTQDYDFVIGKANVLKKGEEIALIATGTMVAVALNAAKELEKNGHSCTVVDMHTIKPLDTEAIDAVMGHRLVVTVEEHMTTGGLGSAVAEYLVSGAKRPVQLRLGVEDAYPDASEYEILLRRCGLTTEGVLDRIYKVLAALDRGE